MQNASQAAREQRDALTLRLPSKHSSRLACSGSRSLNEADTNRSRFPVTITPPSSSHPICPTKFGPLGELPGERRHPNVRDTAVKVLRQRTTDQSVSRERESIASAVHARVLPRRGGFRLNTRLLSRGGTRETLRESGCEISITSGATMWSAVFPRAGKGAG